MSRHRKQTRRHEAQEPEEFPAPASDLNLYSQTTAGSHTYYMYQHLPTMPYGYSQGQTGSSVAHQFQLEESIDDGEYDQGYALPEQYDFIDMIPQTGSPVDNGRAGASHHGRATQSSRRRTDAFVRSQQHSLVERHRSSTDPKKAKKHKKKKADKAVKDFDNKFNEDKDRRYDGSPSEGSLGYAPRSA